MRRYGVEIMGIKFIKKKKGEVVAANVSADLKTTVDKWTCWGCGHVNSGDVCEVCGKKRVQK